MSEASYISKMKGLVQKMRSSFVSNKKPMDTSGIICDVNNQKHKIIMDSMKGIDFFLDIAEELTEYRFVVCGVQERRIVDRISKLENTEYWGWCKPKDAYTGAKLVLLPSSNDTFGRVPIEAGLVGIPSISSMIGGLPESVGNGGISIDLDKRWLWVSEINRLMKDPETWREYSNRAKSNSQRFLPNVHMKNLLEILKKNNLASTADG